MSQLPPRTDYPFRILPFDGILGLAPSASGGSVMHASGMLRDIRDALGVAQAQWVQRMAEVAILSGEH